MSLIRRNLLTVIFAAGMASALPFAASAEDAATGPTLHGRVSESIFNNSDDASSQNYQYFQTRVYLDAERLSESGNSLHFDGAYRSQNSGNTYNSQTPDLHIDQANYQARQIMDGTDVTLGRQYVDSLVGARVDGALFQHYFNAETGLGVFGGTMPDPYNDSFTSAHLTYGLYGYHRDKTAGLTLGYATSLYKGKEDQAYLFGSGYYTPDNYLNMYSSLRMDHNITVLNGYDITNLLINLNYRVERTARLSLTLNQYRGIWYQESMDYSLTHEMQRAARVYAEYNVTLSSRIYGQADYRTRDSDNKSASLYSIGYRDSDLWASMYYNVAYRGISYFTSTSWQGFLAIGAEPHPDFSGEISFTYMSQSQDNAPNAMTQMIYSASANWHITHALFFNALIEYSAQQFLNVDSVYLAKYNDNYRSTAVYANLDYRF